MEIAEKEKNWTFFQNGARAIYSLNPLRILSIEGEASLLQESKGVNDWPHGQPRGGTQIFQLNGWASHFFHSSVKIADSKHGPVRQYFAGLLCHDPSTMAPIAISERPILIGSPCSVEDRPSQHQVVFPCGLVDLGRSVVVSYGLDDLDRAIAESEDHGFIKVLTPPGKDRILGAVVVGTHAGEILAEFTLAMKHGLGLNKILGTIHPYPTWNESAKYAAGEWKRAHAPQGVLNLLEKLHGWRRGKNTNASRNTYAPDRNPTGPQ